MPWSGYSRMDRALEEKGRKANKKISNPEKGLGPTYSDCGWEKKVSHEKSEPPYISNRFRVQIYTTCIVEQFKLEINM